MNVPLEISAFINPSAITALGKAHWLLISLATQVPAFCYIAGHIYSPAYPSHRYCPKCMGSSCTEPYKCFVSNHPGFHHEYNGSCTPRLFSSWEGCCGHLTFFSFPVNQGIASFDNTWGWISRMKKRESTMSPEFRDWEMIACYADGIIGEGNCRGNTHRTGSRHNSGSLCCIWHSHQARFRIIVFVRNRLKNATVQSSESSQSLPSQWSAVPRRRRTWRAGTKSEQCSQRSVPGRMFGHLAGSGKHRHCGGMESTTGFFLWGVSLMENRKQRRSDLIQLSSRGSFQEGQSVVTVRGRVC